jgi:hypothetical protein
MIQRKRPLSWLTLIVAISVSQEWYSDWTATSTIHSRGDGGSSVVHGFVPSYLPTQKSKIQISHGPHYQSRRRRWDAWKPNAVGGEETDTVVEANQLNPYLKLSSLHQCQNESQIYNLLETESRDLSPSIAAASLQRLSHCFILHGNSDPTVERVIQRILQSLTRVVHDNSPNNNHHRGEVDCLTNNPKTIPAALPLLTLVETLHATATLVRKGVAISTLAEWAITVWKYLDKRTTLVQQQLGPLQQFKLLQSISHLQAIRRLIDRNNNSQLYIAMCQRLAQGDALSHMTARDLMTLLHSLTSTSTVQPAGALLLVEQKLIVTASKRLRKLRGATATTTLISVMETCARIVRQHPEEHDESMTHALRQTIYTLVREVLSRMLWDDGTEVQPEEAPTAAELARIFRAASVIHLNETAQEDDVVMARACEVVVHDEGLWLDSAMEYELACILQTLVTWHCRRDAYVGRVLGQHTLHLVETLPTSVLNPKHMNEILRCAALLYTHDSETIRLYWQVAERLVQDDDGFLAACSMKQLANLLWFAHKTHWHDSEAVLDRVGQQILRTCKTIVCSPRVAARILSTFTSVVVARGEGTLVHHALFVDLFATLGRRLLSPSLSILDASSVLYAYGRAQYTNDMTTVYHLAKIITNRIDECSIRQLTQCFWACAKLKLWKGRHEPKDFAQLLFYRTIRIMATSLAQRSHELGPTDVAQVLWAAGQLGLNDLVLLEPWAERAMMMTNRFTSSEMAITWRALSQLRFQTSDVLFALKSRLLEDVHLQLSAQDAATILYSLGRLRIREEALFHHLTSILLEHIETTSAQGLANALWAHEAVFLEPPQILLDSWAQSKLGLVAVDNMEWKDV